MQAHGTRYALPHEPFVVFDLMIKDQRQAAVLVAARCADQALTTPRTLHVGGPFPIERAVALLGTSGHGALDPVEGAVWRVERKGQVDFLAKYVRGDKVDGGYLPEVSGQPAVWNWQKEAGGD